MPHFDSSNLPPPRSAVATHPRMAATTATAGAARQATGIVVPLHCGAARPADSATPRRGDDAGDPPGRILVIDDNAAVLVQFRRILAGGADAADDALDALEAAVLGGEAPVRRGRPHFVVDLVTSGEAGHERVRQARAEGAPYAVVFVDMRMPGGWDGLATIEALWRADPRLQVVICTAYSDHTWDAVTARLGRTDRLLILKKPFEKIEVLQSACALADKWRLQCERETRLDELERRVAEHARDLQAALSERKAYEREVRHLATHDPLTGLPNRGLLDDRLKRAIARAGAARQRLAVLLLDLDRFKHINNSLGHRVGDGLLKAVADRVEAAVGKTGTVARLGGDEFVLVVSGLAHTEAAAQFAQAVHAAIARPFEVEGHLLHVSASVGVSVYPVDGEDGATLLRHADAAMHWAKGGGADDVRFFAPEIGLQVQERVTLEAALRRALAEREFELHYQPQVDLRSGKVTAMEALIRWRRGGNELVSPARFIPLAEEIGLITAIGEWVLRTACIQTRAWQAAGHTELAVAVNLSAHQLRRSDLPQAVRRVLAESGLAARHLELELTESVLMEENEAVVRTLDEIRALGVKLSLDDFGTGYSSLSYLKRFHFDSVKIDRSFIRDVTRDVGDASLTRAIIAMARSLRLRTVAEGVETAGQLGFLASLRCDTMQGYLFSAPLPAEDISALLRAGKRLPTEALGDAAGERTVLLVDDEPNILTALTRVLKRDGYRILTTTSAREAFELLAVHPVGVIVCDGRMPELSGVEFFGRVKELHPATVRIMLSGYTELNAVTEAINRGAVYKFLTKPWDDDALRASIAEAFRRHERMASDASPPWGEDSADRRED